MKLTVFEGLIFDDFEMWALGEDPGDDIEFALAIAFIHPDGGSGVDGQKWIGLASSSSDSIEVTAIIAVGYDLVEAGELFSKTDDISANGDVAR